MERRVGNTVKLEFVDEFFLTCSARRAQVVTLHVHVTATMFTLCAAGSVRGLAHNWYNGFLLLHIRGLIDHGFIRSGG
jgi:hypothetical protein